MVELQNVSVTYPSGTRALTGVTCAIAKGEFVFLVGPTGHGKSTLLKLIFREVAPTRGRVVVAGQDTAHLHSAQIARLRRRMGIVFQDFRLLTNRTIWENVAFAMRVTGASRKQIHRTIPELLCRVGLSHKAEAYPGQVSAGEQQRAVIARALANSPDLIVADEPTGNLDPETGWGIVSLLDEINSAGATVICATHNHSIVSAMQKRVLSLLNGELVSDTPAGTPYSYTRPEDAAATEVVADARAEQAAP